MKMLRWLRVQWDRVSAVVLFIAGGVTLVVGWIGASNTVFPAEQLPYVVSGAAGGLFMLGLGATFWLSADLRDEWHKMDRLERQLAHDDVEVVVQTGNGTKSGDGDVIRELPSAVTGDRR